MMDMILAVTLEGTFPPMGVRESTEAMVARFKAGAADHEALMAMDDVLVGRLMARVLAETGMVQVGVLALTLYDPERVDSYVHGVSPGLGTARKKARGGDVINEGWWWLVREGYVIPARAHDGWSATRKVVALRSGSPVR